MAYKNSISATRAYITVIQDSLESWNDESALTLVLDNLIERQAQYAQSNEAYVQATQALAVPLKNAVDQSINTKGWEELIALAREPGGLWDWSCPILTDSFFMESRKSRPVKVGCILLRFDYSHSVSFQNCSVISIPAQNACEWGCTMTRSR